MTSQNKTERCAASTMYSTNGANIPNVDAAGNSSARLDGMFSCLLISASVGCSSPAQRHADIARHSPRKIDDLYPKLVAARTKILVPELIDLLRHAGERLLPPGLLLIDGTAFIRAHLVWKAMDLHFGEMIVHRALDDLDCAGNRLLVGEA